MQTISLEKERDARQEAERKCSEVDSKMRSMQASLHDAGQEIHKVFVIAALSLTISRATLSSLDFKMNW